MSGSDAHLTRARAIAFYLPQFHPTPENDRWWGPGFTEWHNVARARPLFRGHQQPKLPGELGFYDLRLEETRRRQASLASEAGVEAFAYWHYWFGGGRTMLETPFRAVLDDDEVRHGFCLAWANESWSSNTWTAVEGSHRLRLLCEQSYPPGDIERHFEHVLPALADARYVRVDGRPLFYVMRPLQIPDPLRWSERWRDLASSAGLGGLYLVAEDIGRDPAAFGFDAVVTFPERFPLTGLRSRLRHPLRSFGHRCGFPTRYDYAAAMRLYMERPLPDWQTHPSILTGWDSTPRRGRRGAVLIGFGPDEFRAHVDGVLSSISNQERERRLIFVKSWNEWAEGNYLEPDVRWGDGLLDELRSAMVAVDSGPEPEDGHQP